MPVGSDDHFVSARPDQSVDCHRQDIVKKMAQGQFEFRVLCIAVCISLVCSSHVFVIQEAGGDGCGRFVAQAKMDQSADDDFFAFRVYVSARAPTAAR
jgi:hypothetical protein